jgi:spermidine synthase
MPENLKTVEKTASYLLNLFRNNNFRLFLLSVWMLFSELFIIRWVSSELRIFAHVSNLVLLACFIGIGLGCYFSDKKTSVLFSFALLVVISCAVQSRLFSSITLMLAGSKDALVWTQTMHLNNFIPIAKGILLTIAMFTMIVLYFFPIGQIMGKMFNSHDRIIIAYSINVLGSILGVWLFSLLSFLYTPPLIWLIISMVLGFIFIERKKSVGILIFICLFLSSSVLISKYYDARNVKKIRTFWSPYQKVDLINYYANDIKLGYMLCASDSFFTPLLDMSAHFFDSNSAIFGKKAMEYLKFGMYDISYQLKDNIKDVLIIGSGAGTDLAAALRNNIKHIDAVDIDPGINKLGELYHPENPYKDSRGHNYIDDARSFFKKTKKKYDVIVFSRLDAHALNSSYNNLRTDHYVYTLESINEAKDILKDDGIIVISSIFSQNWLRLRVYNLLKETFKETPIVFNTNYYGQDNVLPIANSNIVFVISKDMKALSRRLSSRVQLNNYIESHKVSLKEEHVRLTTDDWPYLYLRNNRVPRTYLCIMLTLLALIFISGKGLFSGQKRIDFQFFFLGAAFMLLEFQNITKTALLFGSTWLVNTYTITSVLFLILLANLYVYYFNPKRINLIYFLLCLSVLILYFIPLSTLNIGSYFFKTTFIIILLNLPIFFAGIIFICSLRDSSLKNIALASNILGSSVGGLCESLSFIWGIKSLLLLVFLFYLFSYLAWKNCALKRAH